MLVVVSFRQTTSFWNPQTDPMKTSDGFRTIVEGVLDPSPRRREMRSCRRGLRLESLFVSKLARGNGSGSSRPRASGRSRTIVNHLLRVRSANTSYQHVILGSRNTVRVITVQTSKINYCQSFVVSLDYY